MEDHTEIINELWEIIKEKEESEDDNSYTYKTLETGIKRAWQARSRVTCQSYIGTRRRSAKQ